MKILSLKFLLILSVLLFIHTNSMAQVSLSITSGSIKQIIPEVEKASGYSIFFSNEIPDLNRSKSINVENVSIQEALNKLFEGTNITYEIKENKQIILKHRNQQPKQKTRRLKGRVTDVSDEPLIGASIKIEGSGTGTITDFDGNYDLEVDNNATISVSYIGYISQEVQVGSKSIINIVLKEDAKTLDEVVVIGYGMVKKKDLTGAVASVKGDEIATRKATQLSTALQGAISGVTVTRKNNEPGGTAENIRIRGITSNSSSDPLVIVDGVPGDINQVNPNDVDNISVLKDAASAAIYGSRAAAGVILITTKRATESDLVLTYNGEFGLEIPTKQPKYVGVRRYMEMTNELRANDDTGPDYFEDQINNWEKYHATDPNNYPLTDWTDLILSGSAPRQTHSIQISGGTKSVRTKASLAYDDVNGLYHDRYFQRYTLRVNNDFTISKLISAKLDFNVKRSKHHKPVYDPFTTLRQMPAIYAATWDDGRIAEGKNGGNPYGLLLLGGTEEKWYTQIGGRAGLDIKPFKGMNISAIVAPIFNYNKFKKFQKEATYTLKDDPNVIGGHLDGGGNLYSHTDLKETRNDNYNVTTQLIASYLTTLGKHDINLMAGYENYYEYHEELEAGRNQYVLTSFPYLDNGPNTNWSNSGKGHEYAYRSIFGRVMYSYADRYLFQANIRRDGSSRFAKEHRWGTFPSFSAAWVISEEKFMQSLNADWLSFLKFRASWGRLGNERIGDTLFPYMATIEFSNALFYEGNTVTTGQSAAQKDYPIENITWETTESTDIGLDASFFNSRLRFSADYYWKKTKDMLLEQKIPSYIGFNNPFVNAGKMSTKGYEFELAWNDRIGDVRYSVSVNFSDYLSKMGDLKDTRFIKDNKIKEKGSEFNEWYGFVSDGLFLTEEDVKNSPKYTKETTKVGDIKYKDISGPDGVPDGIISADYDRVPLGGSLPRYLYGGNIALDYKGIDFSVTFQGVGKQKAHLQREMIEPLRNNYGNIPTILDNNYWSSSNSDAVNASAKYPRLTYVNASSNYIMSDYWLFNGRYFRLKNMTLGYTLPSVWTEKISLKKVRVYATASDLFCISNYPSGWDPEMGVSEYPITTSLIFGVSVNF